jgi:hypothetical protein
MVPAGQTEGTACSRVIAAVIWSAQDQRSASLRRRRRPSWVTSAAETGVLGVPDPVLASGAVRAGVRPLLADDDPHPGRPVQVGQADDVSNPRAVLHLPVGIGRGPPVVRTLRIAACMSSVMVVPTEQCSRCDPDVIRVRKPRVPLPESARIRTLGAAGAQPGAAAPTHRMVSIWSAPAFPGPEQDGQRLPAPSAPWSANAVIGCGGAERLLPGGRGFMLL